MEVRPGYKLTEVGVIPEEWEVKQLGDIAQLKNGFSFRSSTYTPLGQFKVVTIASVQDGYMNATECNKVAALPRELQAHHRLRRGDVLISMTGNVGRVCRVTEDDCLLNQRVGKLVPSGIEDNLLFVLLGQRAFLAAMSGKAKGGAQGNLSKSDITEYRFPVPPTLPEQHAIATALSEVDALLGALDRLIVKKRDLKQAVMQRLLTGQTRLPGFHGEWEVKTLGDLFNFSGGYSASRDQLSTEGHCYLHYGDIHGSTKTCIDTHADYQDIPKLDIPLKRVSSNSLLKDGDVVFVDASEDDEGTSRHVVVVNKDNIPFISGLHTIVAKSKTDELAHEYRRYCFQTTAIRQQFLFYAVGTKVSGISKTNIPKLTLPVPSVPEQTAIAAVLTDMDAELAALTQRLAKTRALKQGMMQELLTGRTRLVVAEVAA